MEFWDEKKNEALHVLKMRLSADEAGEMAAKIRAVRGTPTRIVHELVFEFDGAKVTLFVHPEDPLTV